jgi:hypothetical protein
LKFNLLKFPLAFTIINIFLCMNQFISPKLWCWCFHYWLFAQELYRILCFSRLIFPSLIILLNHFRYVRDFFILREAIFPFQYFLSLTFESFHLFITKFVTDFIFLYQISLDFPLNLLQLWFLILKFLLFFGIVQANFLIIQLFN